MREFDYFEWEGQLGPGDEFKLVWWDAAQPGGLPAESPPLREPRWVPKDGERAGFPRKLKWGVRMLDANGREVGRSDDRETTRTGR